MGAFYYSAIWAAPWLIQGLYVNSEMLYGFAMWLGRIAVNQGEV